MLSFAILHAALDTVKSYDEDKSAAQIAGSFLFNVGTGMTMQLLSFGLVSFGAASGIVDLVDGICGSIADAVATKESMADPERPSLKRFEKMRPELTRQNAFNEKELKADQQEIHARWVEEDSGDSGDSYESYDVDSLIQGSLPPRPDGRVLTRQNAFESQRELVTAEPVGQAPSEVIQAMKDAGITFLDEAKGYFSCSAVDVVQGLAEATEVGVEAYKEN
jgi:hypothetical protein